jgi:hypothetical protein
MTASRGGPPADPPDWQNLTTSRSGNDQRTGSSKVDEFNLAHYGRKVPHLRLPPIADDHRARAEQAAIEHGTLDQQARVNAHRRDRATKGFVHYFVMGSSCIIGLVCLLPGLGLACDCATPIQMDTGR